MFTEKYLQGVFKKARSKVREESYYSLVEDLLKGFAEKNKYKIRVDTFPKKTEAGNPDIRVLTKKGDLVGYIEGKDFGKELESIEDSEQLERYRSTFPNLILTNFLEFRLYRNGELVEGPIKISDPHPFLRLKLKKIPVQNEEKLLKLIERFLSFSTPQATSAKELAIELAKRTRFLRDQVVAEELKEEKIKDTQILEGFYKAFRDHLISSLTLRDFSNLFAQTITYGLFAARSRSKDGFNRKLAYDYIPHTIGILRDVFRFISSTDLPMTMEWIIDDISGVLDAANVKKIIHDFYKEGKGKDPIIHFYETFLAEYDPTERERRGVYYTPEPVVSYIVRSVHQLLKEKFDKEDGFADSTVTVLDPAAGTLTFPALAIQEAVSEYRRKYGEGGIKGLIHDHILKDFYAFELMMAPYAVGHLKMGFVLDEFGYKLGKDERFKLYLTNTLEAEDLIQSEIPGLISLSDESRLAGKVKREIPILVITGNPPYSVSSDNKSIFIEGGKVPVKISKDGKKVIKYKYQPGLMDLYKEDVRSERNIQPLSDDYIKFIRFAHWKIEQAGKGIIGFITNNSYLSGLIHRGMRKKLAESFDEIYILNLHGNSLIGETTPEGGKDENVFDIRQGVTIALFVRTGKSKKKLATISYHDLYGLRGDVDKRGTKYHYLWNNDSAKTSWNKLNLTPPNYFFVPKEGALSEEYDNFISINHIFANKTTGVKTHRDKFVIGYSRRNLENKLNNFLRFEGSDNLVRKAFEISENDSIDIKGAREALSEARNLEEVIEKISYRPFDHRWIIYHPSVVERHRLPLMFSMLRPNLALVLSRQFGAKKHFIAFVSENITEISSQPYAPYYLFPLFLYSNGEEKQLLVPEQNKLDLDGTQHTLRRGKSKRPNINGGFVTSLNQAYNSLPVTTPLDRQKAFDIKPDEIFYYIYAVLYSSIYREKYQESLKIDFPRVPFTKEYKLFQELAGLGEKLTELHLLKSKELNKPIAKFPKKNGREVKKREYNEKEKRIYINDSQYFEGIVPEVWNYYIGGYQVLDKWLKDRKDRSLSSEDIKHYCKVVTALSETINIQKKIDKLYPKVEKSLLDFGGN